MPHELDYDAAARRLKIGTGYITNVSPAVSAYEVSGKNVLRQWSSYRRKDRSKPPMGDRRPPTPLSDIQPKARPAEYLGTPCCIARPHSARRAGAEAADLLARIVDAPTIDSDTLRAAGPLGEASAEAPEVAESAAEEQSSTPPAIL